MKKLVLGDIHGLTCWKDIISEISNINVNEFDKIEDNSIDKLM